MESAIHQIRRDDPGVPGAAEFTAIDPDGNAVEGHRVAIVGQIHGNEPVGVLALERLEQCLPGRLVRGSVLLVRGNLEAARLQRRHTPEGLDLNRLWDRDHLERLGRRDPSTLCYEERRVVELAPLLLQCDAVLDLHSTSRPSPAHLLFRDDYAHAELARRLGVERLVTGIHENGILHGGICSNVGLRPGEHSRRLGFTLEAGEHTDPGNEERAWWVIVRLLRELGMWHETPPAASAHPVVYEVIDRVCQAPAGTSPWRFVGYEGGELGAGRNGPPRKLASFESVEADEVIARRGSSVVLRAEAPFTMLMPAPTAEPGDDLFFACQRRRTSLQSRPATDAGAFREAEAIERMLDVLRDDAYERGTTWASFTPRRSLDLCAENVARVARLPVGHPHRRLRVVGRGDWGGDEAERRNGKRYRQAVRHAIVDGVAYDRHQLMRGAAFGWLEELASDRLAGMLARRPAGGGPARMMLSLRQPHTVSMLVIGDPERALAEGVYRDARVALVIEATTVEPDGDDVMTHVARTAVFGARPELLRAAVGMVDDLRIEHEHVLAELGDAASELHDRGILDVDGALIPRTADDMAALRRVLYRVHLDSWRELLAGAVTEKLRIKRGELGVWLARVMTETGILDVSSLKAWLVQPAGDGWIVDPARVQAIGDRDQGWRSTPAVQQLVPDQPVHARDVNRDNIERWLGWRRFIDAAESLPDTRGKDVDLVFTRRDARLRVARWYDEACALSRTDPGGWLVVTAGDGLAVGQGDEDDALSRLREAHTALVAEPAVRFVRIQHLPGTWFGWLASLRMEILRRAPDAEPVTLCWEHEHGSSAHVVLLARRVPGVEAASTSLEGWQIVRCAVTMTERSGDAGDASAVGVMTEPLDGERVSHELIHFGRTYCEGLLKQSSWRATGSGGPAFGMAVDRGVQQGIGAWIGRLAGLADRLAEVDPADRAAWIQRHLALRDERVAEALLGVDAEQDAGAEARRVWKSLRRGG